MSFAKGPKYNPLKNHNSAPLATTVIPVYGGSVRISNGDGRNGRGNNAKRSREPSYYDYFAAQAVARSQRLYGPVPGAGGMQFIGGIDMPGTPAYIENPFCNGSAAPAGYIINPFCTQED